MRGGWTTGRSGESEGFQCNASRYRVTAMRVYSQVTVLVSHRFEAFQSLKEYSTDRQ